MNAQRGCPNGHAVPPGQPFCGMCGAKVDEVGSGAVDEVSTVAPQSVVMTRPKPPWWRRRRTLILGVGLVVLIAAGVVIAARGEDGPSTEDYLTALEEAGVDDEFRSDDSAVRAARRLCEDIRAGDVEPVGPTEQKIGVTHFCPEFAEEFEELATEEIEGTFLLDDSDSFRFYDAGDPCSGSGGYSDIGPGAQVQVKDESGTVLAATSLGPGSADGFGGCEFTFSVELTEGADQYLFEVSHRGQIAYSWDDLTSRGAALVLG